MSTWPPRSFMTCRPQQPPSRRCRGPTALQRHRRRPAMARRRSATGTSQHSRDDTGGPRAPLSRRAEGAPARIAARAARPSQLTPHRRERRARITAGTRPQRDVDPRRGRDLLGRSSFSAPRPDGCRHEAVRVTSGRYRFEVGQPVLEVAVPAHVNTRAYLIPAFAGGCGPRSGRTRAAARSRAGRWSAGSARGLAVRSHADPRTRRVRLRIEEQLYVADVVSRRSIKVGGGEIAKVLAGGYTSHAA